jgi:glutamine phosphoribosylpyrophosphate amidotransferase
MVRATGRSSNEFCLACFNGDYPVPYDEKFEKLVMEQRRTKARLLEDTSDRLF